jgi:hypothetical protein
LAVPAEQAQSFPWHLTVKKQPTKVLMLVGFCVLKVLVAVLGVFKSKHS